MVAFQLTHTSITNAKMLYVLRVYVCISIGDGLHCIENVSTGHIIQRRYIRF